MLRDRICSQHNECIGRIEEQFCRSSEIAFFREVLAIEGRRTHEPVNPFRRGSAGGPPLVMKGKFPGEDLEVLYELNRGTKTITYMRQIVLFTDNGIVHIPIPDDMKNPEQFRAKLKELGIERAKEGRIFAAESEMEWVNSLLSSVTIEKHGPVQRSPDQGQVNALVKFEVTDRHFRTVAKIAFHYFLKQMTQFHGSEDNFAPIRNFILNGGNIADFVAMSQDQVIIQIREGLAPKTYNHFLMARAAPQRLYCKLQFFLGPDYAPPLYVVNLGVNPARIYYDQSFAHQFEYYENGKIDGYNGEMHEVQKIRKEFLS